MSTALTIISAGAALFIPGFMLLRMLGMPRGTSLCAAGAASVAIYTILGEVYYALGVTSNPLTLLLAPSILLGVPAAYRAYRDQTTDSQGITVMAAFRYAAIGLAAFWVVYFRRIPFDTLLMEYYDNVFHYNNVRALAQAGDFSILHAPRFYATPADMSIAPWPIVRGFYPFGWHFVSALVLQMTSQPMALVTNAVNLMICGAVFPLGMALLNEAIAPNDPHMHLAGSLLATAMTGFPWMLVLLWPLYPNSFGLALAPAAAGLFVMAVRDHRGARKVLYALAFILAIVGVTAAHPNTIFTLFVLLFPFLGGRILAGSGIRLGRVHVSKYVFAALYCVSFACGWMFLYYSPAFSGVVSFNWGTDLSLPDGLHDVLSMGYMYHLDMDEPQWLIALLSLIGCLACLKAKSGRWTIGSFALASFIMFAELVLSSANPLKHILAGFWYTDPYRVAASTTVCVLPLATLGLSACLKRLDAAVVRKSDTHTADRHRDLLIGSACALFLAVTYLPQLSPLLQLGIQTPFGDYRMLADLVTARKDVLDSQELAFLAKADALLPEDAVVINYPYDGSNFAYGALGTRVLYRPISGYEQAPEDESVASALIRANLPNVAHDANLREALRGLGDCYVLKLDYTYSPDENGRGFYLGETFAYDTWAGLLSVADDTPGLTLVLAEGDYRLYHIDP